MGLLYTQMKAFHFMDKINSLPESSDKTLPPIHVRIKPTNVCNHNCIYCAYRSNNLQLGQNMSLKDFIPKAKMIDIINDLEDMGVKAITFSGGGEPFCYPYLLETVKRLADSSIKFASLTNGTLLTDEISEIFAHHATWVRISIDGWDAESYSVYRKISNSKFSNLIQNMERFKKIGGKCYLGISIIADRNNAGHIYDLIKRLKNTGADSVKISPCIVNNDAAKNNHYHEPVFDKIKNQVIKATEDLMDERFEIYDAYHELSEKFGKGYTWCPYLQILPVIGADLNVYSCQDKAYNLDYGLVGSIKNQSFRDFWFNDKKAFFKIIPSKHCNHHCVANKKNKIILEYLDADDNHLDFV